MKKQKILLITARSDLGGGPKYLLDFARSLESQADLSIASPLTPPFGSEFQKIAAHHIPLPHRSFHFGTFFHLWSFIRSEKIEIIHSHGRGAGIYSRLLKFTGAKIVHSFHGIHQEPTLIGKTKFWIDRILNSLTDGFVFVSESEQTEASRLNLGNKRSAIVYAIISPPSITKKEDYQQPIQLGSISRLTYAKGIDLLFANLQNFLRKHPEIQWHFHLAGDGDLNLTVPNELRSRVTLHGAIPEPYAFLKTLDIYLANSRWESFNISVLEAIACHLTALISNVRGHEYFIRSEVARGFDLDQPDQFANALFDLIQNRPQSHADWVRQNHSQMTTDCLYYRLLGNRS